MAASDLPAEAVEAAAEAIRTDRFGSLHVVPKYHETEMAQRVLAAAAPHLRAQFLAEVDAALRDTEGYVAWARKRRPYVWDVGHLSGPADYLRDTLGAGGDGEG